MEKYEDKELCKTCGKCCLKCGCDYIPEDFENLGVNYIYDKLMEGKISIVSCLSFEKVKDKIVMVPFLYLRARNRNRDIVDLVSLKTTCSLLKKDGCPYTYENRPSGGKNLVPVPDGRCYPKVPLEELAWKWEPYQKMLARLVKRISGYSVDDKIKLDIVKMFIDVIVGNYQDVSEIEKEECAPLLINLRELYPELYRIANEIVRDKEKESAYVKIKK